jgi:hypothetical protein
MPGNISTNTGALTRGGLVPYIATWSGEEPVWAPVISKRRSGIGYQWCVVVAL